MRHCLCWGVPILLTLLIQLSYPNAYQVLRTEGDLLHPWCGIRDDTDVRGVKALMVHMPRLAGAVLYAYFFYYISAAVDPSSKHEATHLRKYNETRISTSAHLLLLHASEEKRLLDISRAAITLRLCMAAFMLAYLVQTVAALYVEHFRTSGHVAELVYLMRVYMITSQQFIYACVFSNQRPGSILGHFLQYHSATISSGRQKVNLNTRVQKYILEKKLHATQKVQSSMGSKPLLSATKSTDAAAAIVRSTSIQNNIQLKNKLLVILKELGRIGQAVLFSPVSFFVWVPVKM